ncbi:SDR family oxidoreductase [Tellurirhabdus bombi]|uniref:SDR family oxidoreductase n=1 Tax=Tellurirhabdus bombi TaxID=2907205 RepID=UPI001F413971|nr:SDR family NAD(P)-dependent oxidoreductase [Tellurirhabdus bombi]
MQLAGNTVLITGGTSGIGLAFAEQFLKAGSNVIICGRREDRLAEIKQQYPELITKVCDVTNAKERESLALWIMREHSETNVLINNAGIQLKTKLTDPVDMSRISAEVETNFIAPVHLISLFSHQLASQHEAAIINISSGLAFAPLAPMPIYCATKAAIHSLTLSIRHQFRDTPVKVFEIAPPAVDTELGHDHREDKTQSHGGMPIDAFIQEAMEAIKNDTLEAAIGQAAGLRSGRESLFDRMNP